MAKGREPSEPSEEHRATRLRRRFYWYMAMANEAHEYSMRLHGVHPEQNKGGGSSPEGVEIRMPGGVVGHKRAAGR